MSGTVSRTSQRFVLLDGDCPVLYNIGIFSAYCADISGKKRHHGAFFSSLRSSTPTWFIESFCRADVVHVSKIFLPLAGELSDNVTFLYELRDAVCEHWKNASNWQVQFKINMV